jgi:ferredoxin-NADP reductase
MLLNRPLQYTARLEDKQVLNEKFTQFSFELTQPNELAFASGQYVSIQVTERGDRRSYSISSSPGINHGFELLVEPIPNGLGSTYLQNLKFGDEIKILAPMGRFVLDDTNQAFTFIATGSGLAPYRSMVLDLLQVKRDTRPITLYWGLRHAEELVYQDEFQQLATVFPNFKFHPVLSQAPQEWPLCRGRVTDCLAVHSLTPNSGYYLCGSDKMLQDMMVLLAQRGIAPTQIHHEKFS